MGVAFVPDVFAQAPQFFRNIFGSPVTVAGIVAILLDTILPKGYGTEFDKKTSTNELKPLEETVS